MPVLQIKTFFFNYTLYASLKSEYNLSKIINEKPLSNK